MRLGARHGQVLARALEMLEAEFRRGGFSPPGEVADLRELAQAMGQRVTTGASGGHSGRLRVGVGDGVGAPGRDRLSLRPGVGVLLDRREVAGWLGVSARTVARREAEGDLVAVRVGRQKRYRWEDLEAFIERQRTE